MIIPSPKRVNIPGLFSIKLSSKFLILPINLGDSINFNEFSIDKEKWLEIELTTFLGSLTTYITAFVFTLFVKLSPFTVYLPDEF